MKTFKHKTTKEIAKLCKDDNNFYRVNDSLVMPKRFIENTNDWKEIIEEYPLSYKDLISNESYTFEEIGHLYTFNLDEGVWYNHSFDRLYNSPLKKISDNKFRLATEKEIEMLIPKNKNYPVGTKVIDTNPDTEGYVYEKQKSGFWKINNMDGYTISESSIGEGKRFRLVEDYPLTFNDLKNNCCYTTEYSGQGRYTFKMGYNLWVNHNSKIIHTNDGNFTPSNGFNKFRYPTKEEIDMLTHKKDYEILSIKNTNTKTVYHKLPDGQYNCWTTNINIDTDNIVNTIKNGKVIIKSVKRLSDNTIFTIGDIIKGKSGCICSINEIWLNPDCESQILFNHKDEGIDLQNALKSLFISDDNVHIFKGDIIYPVNTTSFNHDQPIPIATGESVTKYGKGYKHFSTKAVLDDFILMNKPMVSLNEVKDNAKLISNALGIVLLEKLKEIVKSKLEK